MNLSKVFSELVIEVAAILSYHISEKETLCPLLILLRVVRTLSVSEVYVYQGVDGKVGLHSLDPSYSVGGFSRKVCGEGHLEFLGFGGHWCYWGYRWCWGYEGLPWWCWENSALSWVLGVWGVRVKGTMVEGSGKEGYSFSSLDSRWLSP